MEISIISEENIKPSLSMDNLKPFKLSLLDQLCSRYYASTVFFYPYNGTSSMITANLLKKSLSKTLDLFYPLSGRLQDNQFVYNFNEGASFIETRVQGHLLDFLHDPRLKLLNKLLPCEPLCLFTDESFPQILVQLNIFDCGGIALGVSFFHKVADAKSGAHFYETWASIARGSHNEVTRPSLFEVPSVFPPIEPPLPYDKSTEKWLSKNERLVVRRFVFSENALVALKLKSKSDAVKNPSRIQAVSAFIWKLKMAAYKRVHKSRKPSMLIQVKEIREVIKPRLSSHAFGNIYMNGSTRVVDTEMELSDLVVLIKEGLDSINSDSLKLATILEQINVTPETLNDSIDLFSVNSWSNFSFDDIDFGWGKPIWTGLYGEPSKTRRCVSNLATLKRVAGRKNAMEAWLTLDEEIVDAMENDPEFVAFATPNPAIISGQVKHSRL